MIEGFLETISLSEARGWAFDAARPDVHLAIAITQGDRVLGQALADLYRHDLEAAGHGNGDHAFIVRFSPSLADADLEHISARVTATEGEPVTLQRLSPPPVAPVHDRQSVLWPGGHVDLEHQPLFILGAARSGTSAIAHALLEATDYEGNEEGHVFDVLAPLSVALHKFEQRKADERAIGRNTTAARIDPSFFQHAVDAAMIAAARKLFPSGRWLDKTPNSDMVYVAPRLQTIWPNARFIFMKRHGIENICSRLRKFEYDFSHNCREWARVMTAWLEVKGQLGSAQLELDQSTMARNPYCAAAMVARHLGLVETLETRIGRIMASEHPQRTSESKSLPQLLSEVSWTSEQMRVFREVCGPAMDSFAYPY